MELDEAIKFCEDVAETNKGIAERYKEIRPYEDGWDFWEKESKTSYAIADWLKMLKDIQSTGSCNTCNKHSRCDCEPDAGQIARYNCPFYKEERISKMTYGDIYGDIYEQFCKKFPNAKVSDYSPAYPQFLPNLVQPIPYAIVVWLKDGTKVVYMAESEDDND